jgi:glycosyltransferase involved in cell wall biosynthesis
VVRGARVHLPVIVIDDGSTDSTAARLNEEKNIEVVTHPSNRGKAAALQTGFAQAEKLGFTHAITIDADGQHATSAIPAFHRAIQASPAALIVGVRDFAIADAPIIRRIPNWLSNLCFRFETGLRLGDTQCGYRAYPLTVLRSIKTRAGGYGYELEVLVKAAWAGTPVVPLDVDSDYAAPTSRLSHFHPLKDLFRVSRLHLKLLAQSLTRRRQRAPA